MFNIQYSIFLLKDSPDHFQPMRILMQVVMINALLVDDVKADPARAMKDLLAVGQNADM